MQSVLSVSIVTNTLGCQAAIASSFVSLIYFYYRLLTNIQLLGLHLQIPGILLIRLWNEVYIIQFTLSY